MPMPTDPWWRAFIAADPPRTGKLGVVRADGRPHVTPVWVALDGDDLVFKTGAGSVKGQALAHNPRVSVCFDDERPPYAFVAVSGTALLSDDPDEMLRWATIIAGRHMGDDRAEEFGRRNAVPGELLVRVGVDHVAFAKTMA